MLRREAAGTSPAPPADWGRPEQLLAARSSPDPREGEVRAATLRRRNQLHLDPAFLALVERLVGADRVVEPDAVRQDPRRIELAASHEIEEPRDVAPVIAVAHVDRQVLLHGLAD